MDRTLKDMLPDIVTYVSSHKQFLQYNNRLMLVHEGQLRPEIEKALREELSAKAFARARTRIPSINLLVRIIDKLSRLYSNPPLRTASNEGEEERMQYWIDSMKLDQKMASANRMFNLHKGCALEPYVSDGVPRLRILPYDQFLPYSDDPNDPMKVTAFIKFMGKEEKSVPFTDVNGYYRGSNYVREVEIYYVYTDTEFAIVDSDAEVQSAKMDRLGQDGSNPVGRIPFVYINRSDFRLVPLPDTDTLDNTILIPKLLADLNYAVQFQSHSMVAAVDMDIPADMEWNPDVILNLKSNQGETGRVGSIQVIKPEVDIPQVLGLIEAQLGIWLESRNIKAGTIGGAQTENAESGLAKIIDESDATQDRVAQIPHFIDAEYELWELNKILSRVWTDASELNEPGAFPDDFYVITEFAEQQPVQSERERAEIAQLYDALGVVTLENKVKMLFPELDDESVLKRVEELEAQKQKDMAEFGDPNGNQAQQPPGAAEQNPEGDNESSNPPKAG